MRYYVSELQNSGYDVQQRRTPDDALETLKEDADSFDLIILDSSMPRGKRYTNQATEEGTLTGSLLFKDIKMMYPKIPILILTNFSGLDWVQAESNTPRVLAAAKLDFTPSKLVEAVGTMIKNAQ